MEFVGGRSTNLALSTRGAEALRAVGALESVSYLPFNYPNVSMHILDTALYKSPKVLVRRICLPVKSFYVW